MYKAYFGARIEKLPVGCWEVSVSFAHEWAVTYLCICLVKYQLLIGRLIRWKDDL